MRRVWGFDNPLMSLTAEMTGAYSGPGPLHLVTVLWRDKPWGDSKSMATLIIWAICLSGSTRGTASEDQAGPLGTRPETAPLAARIAARGGGLTVARSAKTLMLPASLSSEPYGVLGTARPSQPRR
jgi:hypothetical protein